MPPEFYEQLCSERIVTKYSRGRRIRAFERVRGLRAEALDAVTYAIATRGLIGQSFDAREAELASPAAPKGISKDPACRAWLFLSPARANGKVISPKAPLGSRTAPAI
jgi:phage terminase large subunit GpA-like protein